MEKTKKAKIVNFSDGRKVPFKTRKKDPTVDEFINKYAIWKDLTEPTEEIVARMRGRKP